MGCNARLCVNRDDAEGAQNEQNYALMESLVETLTSAFPPAPRDTSRPERCPHSRPPIAARPAFCHMQPYPLVCSPIRLPHHHLHRFTTRDPTSSPCAVGAMIKNLPQSLSAMTTGFATPTAALQLTSSFTPAAPATSALRRARTPNVAAQRGRRVQPHMAIDQNTILGVLAGAAGLGGGIALVAWTETQGERTDERANTQLCFECKGAKVITCEVCEGSGQNPLDASLPCSNCDGAGTITCPNCGGTGIQPRFLDRFVSLDVLFFYCAPCLPHSI